MSFWSAIFEHPFARNALLMGLLASVACGVVGSFVVARRISYIAAGIAHALLAGLGGAQYLRAVHGWDWLDPMHGAIAAGLLAAGIIGTVALYAREREDTAISAVWAVGMAVGILFMYKTPGYNQDLMSYLFGNILLVSTGDLWLVGLLDLVIVAAGVVFFRQLEAVCFDEEFSRLRNIPVNGYYMLLLLLTALTVVLLVTVVGIVLVIALLTLPVAMAGRFSQSLAQMMALSAVICGVFTVGGLAISYGPNLPAGPMIILLTGLGYLAVMAGSILRRKGVGPG